MLFLLVIRHWFHEDNLSFYILRDLFNLEFPEVRSLRSGFGPR